MASKVYVVGVGMTEFIKPRGLVPYEEMGLEAVVKALLDAGLSYDEVQYAVAAFCFGDSCSGQRTLYQLGMTGIPIMNVNNNCSTGSTAIFNGRTLVQSGVYDCVLCVGFEKMERGSLEPKWGDRSDPISQLGRMMRETCEPAKGPVPCQLFSNAGIEYCDRTGGSYDSMARIAECNHRHSAKNPYSQFKDVYTLDQIKSSPSIHGPVTKLQCCPTSDGAASAVLVSERFLQRNPHLRSQAVEIAAQTMLTDTTKTFSRSSIDLVGYDMTERAANAAFSAAGISRDDVQVVEVHDCFAPNELIVIDALGLCDKGKACEFVDSGNNTYGGKYVINPSGGLISKGHPLGATGLAQCAELVWHLRGWATNRSVPNTRYALQHNLGLGGAVVIGIYKRADGQAAPAQAPPASDGRSRLGYNPAIESHPITKEMLRKVQANQHSDYMFKGSNMFKDAQL
jgi:sterol carrier protein 2